MNWLLALPAGWIVVPVHAQEQHFELIDGWEFTQVGTKEWYPAVVPGTVHTDLLRNGLIPDPYLNSNVDSA